VRGIAFMIIGILLVSLVPAAGGVSSETASASTRAHELLIALDRLASYVNETGCGSGEADALREKAWELYRAGDYNRSAEEALKAMDLYRSALEHCAPGGGSSGTNEWVSVAETELAITANVLEYAKKLIDSGELSGKDLEDVKVEYSQTLQVYEGLKESLAENDTRDLPRKVAFLRTSREELERAIELAVGHSLRKTAPKMAEVQLRMLDELVKRGRLNATEALVLKERILRAVTAGSPDEILKVLRDVSGALSKTLGKHRRGKNEKSHPGVPASNQTRPVTNPKPKKNETGTHRGRGEG